MTILEILIREYLRHKSNQVRIRRNRVLRSIHEQRTRLLAVPNHKVQAYSCVL